MARMRRFGWLLALGLACVSGAQAQAEPMNYLAGSVYRFSMTSTGPQGGPGGPVSLSINFGSADASFINSGAVSPLGANFGSMSFNTVPFAFPVPPGGPSPVQASQALYPTNFNANYSIAFPTGMAGFTANITMGSVMLFDSGPGGASENPFPALPPGPNGLTLLGTVFANANASEEDLSLFGADSGAIFSMVLLADDPNFSFLDMLQYGGSVEGTAAYMQIGGSPSSGGGGGGSEVPEPLSLLTFGAFAGAGLYVARKKLAN